MEANAAHLRKARRPKEEGFMPVNIAQSGFLATLNLKSEEERRMRSCAKIARTVKQLRR
jgi:hypothetical protein